MKGKYETRCWLCSSTDLEPDTRGIRCRKCGATYNVIPKPGSDPLTIEKDTVYKDGIPLTMKHSRPSGHVQHHVAKARGDLL